MVLYWTVRRAGLFNEKIIGFKHLKLNSMDVELCFVLFLFSLNIALHFICCFENRGSQTFFFHILSTFQVVKSTFWAFVFDLEKPVNQNKENQETIINKHGAQNNTNMSIHVTRTRKRAWAREKWAPLKHQQKKGPLAEGRETPGASRARGRLWLFDHYTVKQKLKKIIKNLAHWVTCNFEFDTNVLVHCRCRAVWTKSKMRENGDRGRKGEYCSFFCLFCQFWATENWHDSQERL